MTNSSERQVSRVSEDNFPVVRRPDRSWTPDELDKYYYYLCHEISREDTIALARTAALLTFQGFALSAVGLMMTADWPDTKSTCLALGIAHLRVGLLFLLGIAGFFIAHGASRGIKASFNALEAVKDEWEAVLRQANESLGAHYISLDTRAPAEGRFIYQRRPRTYGPRTKLGTQFGLAMPRAFSAIWGLYLLLCSLAIPYTEHCKSAPISAGQCRHLFFTQDSSEADKAAATQLGGNQSQPEAPSNKKTRK